MRKRERRDENMNERTRTKETERNPDNQTENES